MTDIAVIVVAKDRSSFLRRCVTSLQSSRLSGKAKVVCYALESSDDTLATSLAYFQSHKIDDLVLEETTPFASETLLHGTLHVSKWGPRYVYFCADDYEMKKDWFIKATRFLDASPDVAVLSLELEPSFPWNEPIEILDRDNVKALVRPTLPGANWMMTYASWCVRVRPVFEKRMLTRTYDLDVCKALLEADWKLAAIDAADHIGAYHSCCGNRSFQTCAKPLDKKWSLE